MDGMVEPGGLDRRIAAIRRFNRFYTSTIGVVQDKLLHSRFTLAEARVLYELADRGRATAAEITRELHLDAGYLSRILRGFEQDGLLTRLPAPDRRQTLLSLTDAGRAAFAPLDAASRAEIGSLIGAFPEQAQTELIQAMDRIAGLLGARDRSKPTLRGHQPGDIGWVVSRHGAVYAEEYGFDETFEALVAEIAGAFLKAHDPVRERCWIAERDGTNVGSVFLVRHSDEIGKLRLLIVEPGARGLGVGRALVGACVGFARQAGYRRITLWTQDILVAARHLYAEAGFRLVQSAPHHSFGLDLIGENWELDLG
jgi:DNA-binding MarR family transcriptional regulator